MNDVRIRALSREELAGVWAIDRAERIEEIYRVEAGELVLARAFFDVRDWPEGEPEEYGPLLLDCFDHGGSAEGAFADGALVGAAVLEGRFIGRGGDRLQLKFLHVSQGQRGRGVGRTLFERAAARARGLGARALYVSSTSTRNTVDFYLRRGCQLAAERDPALFALEPEDIHLELSLQDAASGEGRLG